MIRFRVSKLVLLARKEKKLERFDPEMMLHKVGMDLDVIERGFSCRNSRWNAIRLEWCWL